MNLFIELFRVFVYEPQLNLLYLIFKLTNGEIGLSFILLAILVNLFTLPLFIRTFVNIQKNRILAPQIQEIQAKHRKEPQVMMQKMREFNQKHNIDNRSLFLVLLVQIFFVSGLFYLIKDVVEGKDIRGLYEIFWGTDLAKFKGSGPLLAFGQIDIGASASQFLWIPILSLILSYLYGMYTFRWAPKPKIPEVKKAKSKKNNKPTEPPLFDPEMFQKTTEFQQIYVLPVFLFIFQYNLPTGLNIYFATTSALSLLRQIFLTNFYSRHTDILIEQIIESDPVSKDDNPDNNLENTAIPAQMDGNLPIAEKILEKDTTRFKTKKVFSEKLKKKYKGLKNKKDKSKKAK